jgi:diacylglycerol kinase
MDKEECIIKSETSLITNFGFATQGIIFSLSERSIRICYLAVICTTATGLLLKISISEWCVILIMFVLVISFEMVNTAMEIMVDMISPEFNGNAGKIKDIAAGAVLIASIVAVIVGLIIFVPKIMALYTYV